MALQVLFSCTWTHKSLYYCTILKRHLNFDLYPSPGTCQRYTPEGQSCDTFAKPNGYCGCTPGLHCNMVERPLPDDAKHPTFPSVHFRDMRPNRPGYEWITRCEKTSTTVWPVPIRESTIWMLDLGSKSKIGSNGTNLGLFQIRFQYILAQGAKMYWNLIWKKIRIYPFGTKLSQLGA